MSIKKNNTYFQENDGKIYFYDVEGVKKEIPSTAFSNLQEQIDNLGSPLTYSGAKSIEELNNLTNIKQGTVYTVTGVSGTLTAGEVEVKKGDEVAWADSKWVEIGKDIDNSWKQWSEDNGSSSVSGGIYIGKNNSADYIGINIGAENQILNGDDTLGASVNIGKSLVNRYGVLIGQNIESNGYGIGVGSNITNVYCGDLVLGYDIKNNYNSNGRTIIGSDISGSINDGGIVFGKNITADYLGYGALAIGQRFKANVQNGSMVMSQLAYDDDCKNLNGEEQAISANYDSIVIGGYSNAGYIRSNYINPSIYAYNNGIIIGQGQVMSAYNDSYIFGNEAYAYNHSKVIGNNGYATNDSMVINYPSFYLYSQNVGVYTINGKPISGNIQVNYKPYKNRYNNVKYVNYYYDENNNLVMSANTSNVFSGEYLNDSYWHREHYYLESNDKNYAVAVFNLTGGYTLYKVVTGTWIDGGKNFQEESTGTETAYKLTGWSGNPMILINDNGTRNFYVYNDLSDADKATMPHYFKIRKSIRSDYTRNALVTDKKYLYTYNDYYSTNPYTMDSDVPSALLCTSSTINSVILANNQTVFEYNDNTFSIGNTRNITGYEWSGESASQLGYVNSSVYPSAIFSADPRQVVTNSTADQASLAIGPGNSAVGGSIAINGCHTQYHHIINSNNMSSYGNYTLNSTGGMYNVWNSAITNTNLINDPLNKAEYNSISMGIGTKGGWQNSASNYSLAIGSKVTAGWNSIAIGQTLSATDYSYAFGTNAVTADNFSFGIGANGVRSNDFSYAIGNDGIYADRHSFVFGTHGVYAENNGFAFGGQGITARNQGMAFGFYGVYAENIDSNPGGNGQGWGIAIGSNGVTSRNGGIAFGYNGVYSENKGCIAIGASGVNATGSPAIAIGSYGVQAQGWSLSMGTKGRASNHSINIAMSNSYGSFTTAENGSINLMTVTDSNCSTYTTTKSITLKSTNAGYSTTQYGSININANTEGWFGTSAINQSIIFTTKKWDNDSWYISSYNNSVVIGAGIENTTASNDSISIGGGKKIEELGQSYGDWSQQVYNGSIALGNANTANGGVYIIGKKNTMGTTYSTFTDRPIDYTQTFVVGEANTACNYRPYLWAKFSAYSADKYISAYISTDNNKQPHGAGEASYTRSMIVGNYNSMTAYNSFIFGTNNTAGCTEYAYRTSEDAISGDPNDDGFLYIFGLNNRAYRNYDMAIGYGSFASGGENIAIGTPQSLEYYNGEQIKNYKWNTSAVGYKNISIRSNLTAGIENIAINSMLSGNYGNSNSYHWHHANEYINSYVMLNSAGGGGYPINNNTIRNSILLKPFSGYTGTYLKTFCYNTIENTLSSFISGAYTFNELKNNTEFILQNDYSTDGTQHNEFNNCYGLNILVSGGHASYNIFHNAFGKANYNDNIGILSAKDINNNIIFNTKFNLQCSGLEGFNNNFTHNSIMSSDGCTYAVNHTYSFASTSIYSPSLTNWNNCGNDNNVLFFSKYISNPITFPSTKLPGVIKDSVLNSPGDNFLVGTYGENIHAVVSFSDRGYSDFTGYSGSEAVIKNSNRIFNINDNCISGSTNVAVLGEKNGISGIAVANIFGNYNCVTATYSGGYDGPTAKSDFIVINGTENTIDVSAPNCNYVTNNNIFGSNNSLRISAGSADGDQVTHNNIIGDNNGLYEMDETKLSGYDNLYNIYSNRRNNIGTVNYEQPGSCGANWAGAPTKGNSRNHIIGSHNIISQYINDTVLIGSRNLIMNNSAEDYQKQLDEYNNTTASFDTYNASTTYRYGNRVKYNGSAFTASRSNFYNIPPTNTTYWGKYNFRYDPSNNIKSNNFTLGSYNLLRDGSNQINIGAVNTTSGYNATAIGEGLIAKTSQIVVGRFNEELDGTNGLSADNIDSTSGALFIVGNGKHKNADYSSSAVYRSNAMIVSADGTVSAKRFIESDPALTITGGDFVAVTEDTTNNLLTIDLESSLGQMITELSGVLSAKPATGRHILGVDNGTLTWLEVNQ